jgi:mannose-6-phosphate isomerase-like protein (cupin superfamily)
MLQVHATWQGQWATPHLPHWHADEEAIIVLEGEMRSTYLLGVGGAHLAAAQAVEAARPKGARRTHPVVAAAGTLLQEAVVGPREVSFYPPRSPHTLTALSPQGALSLCLRWYHPRAGGAAAGAAAAKSDHASAATAGGARRTQAGGSGTAMLDAAQLPDSPLGLTIAPLTRPAVSTDGGKRAQVTALAGATAYLSRFNVHTTLLAPGEGYDPHTDPYDVLLVVLEGSGVATAGNDTLTAAEAAAVQHAAGDSDGAWLVRAGERGAAAESQWWRLQRKDVGRNAVQYVPAGVPHGMRNTGAVPLYYAAVEMAAAGE